jgi:hypothetical protein
MGLIERHIEKTKMRFPVARTKARVDMLYGVEGFPHAALIDASGHLVWSGHPGGLEESLVKRLLEDAAFVAPVEGKAYKGLNKRIRKREYGKALAEAVKGLKKAPEDAGFAKARASLEGLLEHKRKAAAAAVDAGDHGLAWGLLVEVEELFDGTDEAKAAKARAKELEKLPEAKDAIEAYKKIRKADEVALTGDYEKAARTYKTVASKFPDTASGRRARAFMNRHPL